MHLIYRNNFFTYYQGRNGQDRCILDLNKLFQSNGDRVLFESRWQSFLNSDSDNTHILFRSSDILEYLTESIIPLFCGSKPRLLLLFGNPAPHSVKAGAMFSSEGAQREHRLWRFLAQTGVLSFEHRSPDETFDPAWRVRRLLSTDYDSPFQIAMSSFISFPSAASHPRWSGVAGVKRLFGARAFNTLCNSEFDHLRIVLKDLMPEKGMVVVFQKDAFETLRSTDTPRYSIRSCFSGALIGSIKENPNIFLGSVAPTRLMLSRRAKLTFVKVIKEGLDSIHCV